MDYYNLIPSFKKEIPLFLKSLQNVAIFGDEWNKESMNYKILQNLKEICNVFPIGNNCSLEGITLCDLSSITPKPESAIISLPSKDSLEACQECLNNGITNIWIDLGSESEEAIDFCKKNKINAIYFHSILKERINPSSEYKSRKDS